MSKVMKVLTACQNSPQGILEPSAESNLECTACESGVSGCFDDPARRCRKVGLAGTLLDEYELALKEYYRGNVQECAICGIVLTRDASLRQSGPVLCRKCEDAAAGLAHEDYM